MHHLAAELSSNNIDVAVITETHFKRKHSNSIVSMPDYTVFQRDRTGRRGSSVAVYVRSALQSTVWQSLTQTVASFPTSFFGSVWAVRSSVRCTIYHGHLTLMSH